ncbi:MAG: hypothetical protein B6I28_03610 [Fusobacteriia bacterium 4572_132]|nr:MAG: hypothetical protein B6I28_03610 [Fusobacteriia bacterium 4572_132]
MNLKFEKRVDYEVAYEEYKKVANYLNKKDYQYTKVGSLRRKRDTIGDIDILIKGNKNEVYSYIMNYSEVIKKITEDTFLLKSGIELQIIAEKENFTYTKWVTTGSKKHIKKIEEIYDEKGLKINKKIEDEKEIYERIGQKYLEPKKRNEL